MKKVFCFVCLVCCMVASITAKAETFCSKETGECFKFSSVEVSPVEHHSPQGLRIAAHMMFWPGLVQFGTAFGLYYYNMKGQEPEFRSKNLKDTQNMLLVNMVLGLAHIFTGLTYAGVNYDRSHPLTYPNGKPTKSLSFNGPLVQPPIKNNPGFVGTSFSF